MNENRVLAELLWPGATCQCNYISRVTVKTCGICGKEIAPDFDNSLNAMSEVWQVLKAKRLIDAFWKMYWGMSVKDFGSEMSSLGEAVYYFNSDLPGQVKAAIKVLKETK